jgi:NAD+ diphosphatase
MSASSSARPAAPVAPIPFAGGGLDRASLKRRDAAFIAGLLAHPDTDLILIQDGRPVLAIAPRGAGADAPREALRLSAAARAGFLGRGAPEPIFMGLDARGRATFAAALGRGVEMDGGPLDGLGEAVDLRAAAAVTGLEDLAILGAAKSLFDWHARHGHCANCGARTHVVEAGWKRHCPDCGAEHFPRTDPVAIMLATHDGRCLLGRGPNFPQGYVSALAGFIEPGETIEAGCARELAEEAGVRVLSARIVANQPWPFPSQLMIGLIAEVDDDRLTIDPEELAEAHWFTRAEARALLSAGGLVTPDRAFRAPPPAAIAHHLIKAWAFEAD